LLLQKDAKIVRGTVELLNLRTLERTYYQWHVKVFKQNKASEYWLFFSFFF